MRSFLQDFLGIWYVRAQSEPSHFRKEHRCIVLLQETWLDASTEELAILGYVTVSRKDRSPTPNRGGILILAREDFQNLVHVSDSVVDERSWHFLSLDTETILVGNWYRSPSSYHGFDELQDELVKYYSDCSGVVLSGDCNVHHTRWLRHSNANTAIASDLEVVCDNFGLQQHV